MSSNDMLKGINEIIQHSAMNEDELSHHGIKDMKWGRRRWQNKDGSLKPAGKKRYAEMSDNDKREYNIRERDRADSKRKEKAEKLAKLDDEVKKSFTVMDSTNRRQSRLLKQQAKLKGEVESLDQQSKEADYRLHTEILKKNMEDTGTAYYNPKGVKKLRDNSEKELEDAGIDTTKLKQLRKDLEDADNNMAENINNSSSSENDKKLNYELSKMAQKEYNDELGRLYEQAGIKNKHKKNIEERGGKDEDNTEQNKKNNGEDKTNSNDGAADNDNQSSGEKNGKNKKDLNTPDAEDIAYRKDDGTIVTKKEVAQNKKQAAKEAKQKEKEEATAAKEAEKEAAKKAREEAQRAAEEAAKKAREEEFKKSQAKLQVVEEGADTVESIAKSGSKIADVVAKSQKGKMDADKKAEMDAMSDAQLRQRINRIEMEQKYASLNPNETQRRAEQASMILEGLGYVASITGDVAHVSRTVRGILHKFED